MSKPKKQRPSSLHAAWVCPSKVETQTFHGTLTPKGPWVAAVLVYKAR
jgi:hypothetical protein